MLAPAQPQPRWPAGSVQGTGIRDACDYSQWLFPVRMLAGARRYPLSLPIPPGLLLSCGATGSRCWQSAGVAQSRR